MTGTDPNFWQISGFSYMCFFNEDHNAIQNMEAISTNGNFEHLVQCTIIQKPRNTKRNR
jgi:hypothetical protein